MDNHAAEACCLPISVRVFTKISVAFGQGGGTQTTAALEGDLETGNVVLFFLLLLFLGVGCFFLFVPHSTGWFLVSIEL